MANAAARSASTGLLLDRRRIRRLDRRQVVAAVAVHQATADGSRVGRRAEADDRRQQGAGAIVDVRSALTQEATGRIPGARAIDMQKIERGFDGVPPEGEVIVYCACPNEATAVKVAQQLQQARLQARAAAARRHRRVDRRGAAKSSADASAPCYIRRATRVRHSLARRQRMTKQAIHSNARAGRDRAVLAGDSRAATRSICPVRSASIRPPAICATESRRRRARCSSNLRAVAQAAGGALDDMVKLTLLLVDLADFAKVNEIMATYFTPPYPARATYQVAALAEGRARRGRGRAGARDEVATRRRARSDRGDGPHAKRRSAAAPRYARIVSPWQERSRAEAEVRQHARRQARAARHRARAGSGAAPAAALRGPHARRARSATLAPGQRVAGRGHGRRHRDPVPAAAAARLPARATAAAQLVLRFFHFYPSQQKALAPGKRVRAFGEVREGFFGLEMVHPQLPGRRARARRCPTG